MIVSSFRRYIHNGFSETHANQIKSSQDTSQTEDLRRRNEKAADKKPTKEEEKGSRIEYKKITYRIAHNMSKKINTHTRQKKVQPIQCCWNWKMAKLKRATQKVEISKRRNVSTV